MNAIAKSSILTFHTKAYYYEYEDDELITQYTHGYYEDSFEQEEEFSHVPSQVSKKQPLCKLYEQRNFIG